ncbi:glycoside hydrolase family 16 protein [Amycolatopsis rhizosphaerae]|uniref:Glycoside hydrolase family 16 protein n=1 Tax=Amycolatopsis rhizosphaerae TaxID=2053003 RepID=A0A558AB00_9PSEU|nr:glycoside hydrolase family 16 protein [Amycolatopsis rhizosphaerae]TVT21427.1 glycoside hydrolase family 16 protein [Amycolatopsis rhizosphaerae]
MKRRVVLLSLCLVLAAVAVAAVKITSRRFENSGSQAGPATSAPESAAVVPPMPQATEAAVEYGWQRVGGDEFDGTKVDTTRWEVYDGTNSRNETWSPKQCAVKDGLLTITGLSDRAGTTCGIAWKQDRTYGRWEVRARMPAPADPGYAPIFLLWGDAGNYPHAGEIDFAEEYDPARQYIESWLHGPGNTEGGYFKSKPVDLTQWHNFAVEWEPDRITLYLDGVVWGVYDDPKFIPRTPMHVTLQQNYTPKGPGLPLKSSVEIDWMRMYR